jgi:hypothetical protein
LAHQFTCHFQRTTFRDFVESKPDLVAFAAPKYASKFVEDPSALLAEQINVLGRQVIELVAARDAK